MNCRLSCTGLRMVGTVFLPKHVELVKTSSKLKQKQRRDKKIVTSLSSGIDLPNGWSSFYFELGLPLIHLTTLCLYTSAFKISLPYNLGWVKRTPVAWRDAAAGVSATKSSTLQLIILAKKLSLPYTFQSQSQFKIKTKSTLRVNWDYH